ncbi:endonuclease VII domain-containing protein [Streptomyces sp. NBC_00853]|nr:endonuclease VII domain-containing protein [Streptomyces sp. NBC_00853]
MKRCSRCGEEKPHREYASKRANLDGLQRHCRACGEESHRKREQAMGRSPRPSAPEGRKFCLGCGEEKSHSDWHRKRSAPDGLATRCKACRAVERRVGHLKCSYGMTEADRDEMIDAQGGLCCICLKRPAVHVDHCHKTGRVRGVLCFNCNTAIGKLGDDPDAARRVVSYLEGHAWKPTIVAQGVYRQPS